MVEEHDPTPEPPRRNAGAFAHQTAIALELPFTLVGPILVAGTIGYFLDRWLGTTPWLILILTGLGFYAGVREVYRRYRKMLGSSSGQPK